MEQEQVTLQISENVQHALEYAFEEAEQRLQTGAEQLVPFSVIVVDEGLEVNEHSGVTPQDVHESARALIAQEMPEGYALCYDGYVETDEGTLDALICEVADRGCVAADALALLYTCEDGTYTFEEDWGYAGSTPQLYPAGTKPIVSGLAALADDDEPTDSDFVDAEGNDVTAEVADAEQAEEQAE